MSCQATRRSMQPWTDWGTPSTLSRGCGYRPTCRTSGRRRPLAHAAWAADQQQVPVPSAEGVVPEQRYRAAAPVATAACFPEAAPSRPAFARWVAPAAATLWALTWRVWSTLA